MEGWYRLVFGGEVGALASGVDGSVELRPTSRGSDAPEPGRVPPRGEGPQMSATATPGTNGTRTDPVSTRRDPGSARTYYRVAAVVVATLLTTGAALQWDALRPLLPTMGVWAIVVAIADLAPVRFWGDVSFSMSLPVALAAGIVLGPMPAALVCAVGSTDPAEIKREVGLARAVYNRGQVAVSVWVASTVFHSLGVPLTDWPRVLLPTMLALLSDFSMNMLFVAIPVGLRMRVSMYAVFRRVFGGSAIEYGLAYVSLGFVSLLQAMIVQVAGLWGLVASLAPLGLARLVFTEVQRLGVASSQIETKNRALVDATQRVSDERRDERMALAGELHDEVLPPLFKVHLMGQVLRQDINSGRLLDLDADLPELLSALDAAQAAVRGLVGSLRLSPIGTAGLNSSLRQLAQQLESAGSPPIALELHEVGGSYLSQLLVYQVAREALNNAARHSRATRIMVRLWEEGAIRLVITDDGVGFAADDVDQNIHFGLQLIAERVGAASGQVVVDSRLGEGTTVMAVVPPGIT